MVDKQMEEFLNSPREENRGMANIMKKLKQREVQRTIQVNLAIKRATDWTMPKLKENVLTRKEREKEEKLKELEQKRIAQALRHQLAHQNVLSSMGSWLTKRLGGMIKSKKITREETKIADNLSETTYNDESPVNPYKVPKFSLVQYARNKNSEFPN